MQREGPCHVGKGKHESRGDRRGQFQLFKIEPLLPEMRRREGLKPVLIHTRQHDDSRLSDRFFADLDIDTPAHNLEVGSGSNTVQTADVSSSAEMTSATISAAAP